jgi:hypothetical protein
MPHLTQTHLRGIWAQTKPKFSPKQYVIFDEQVYKVLSVTHTHLQLEGLRYAVPEWLCKPQPYAVKLRAAKSQSSVKTVQEVSALKQNLCISADPAIAETDLRSAEDIIPTAGKEFIAPKPTAWELSPYLEIRSFSGFPAFLVFLIFAKSQGNCLPRLKICHHLK